MENKEGTGFVEEHFSDKKKGNEGVPKTAVSGQEYQRPSKQTLSPFVYWAQNERNITLKIDLRDSETPFVDLTPKSCHFEAKGHGAKGLNVYKFDIQFYDMIDEDSVSLQQNDCKIEIALKKVEEGWWPRLVATPQKPQWLRVDFDKWRSEDDLVDEQPRDVMQDYKHEYEALQKQEFGYVKESSKKVYLIFYNLAQFIGYLYILCILGILCLRDGSDALSKAYSTVGNAMKFCQLLQYLEVLHPIFKYTKGSAMVPFMQVTGRNFILFIMIDAEERMQTKPVVFYLFVLWSLVEIFRYPFYISQLLKREVGLLTWLRYTIWIPLYPLGILCEGVVVLRNIPYFEETQRFTVTLPNQWNFEFYMATFLKLYLIVLIGPGTYITMSHMAKQRGKKLSNIRRKKYIH